MAPGCTSSGAPRTRSRSSLLGGPALLASAKPATFFTFFSFCTAQPANVQKPPLASRSFSAGKETALAAGVSVCRAG